MILSQIFFTAAIIFNAIMDTLADHFSISIFKNLNPNFLDKSVSWQGKKFLGIVRLDAWHIAKYGMFGSVVLSILFYKTIGYGFTIDLLSYLIIWGIIFELFYSKLLKKIQ